MHNNIIIVFQKSEDHLDPEAWNVPISVIREFKRRSWGVEVYEFENETDTRWYDNILRDYEHSLKEPSILLFMDWGRLILPDFFTKKRKDELKSVLGDQLFTVFESGDDPQNYHRNVQNTKGGFWDLVLTPDYDCYEKYVQNGQNCLWWTHFADNNLVEYTHTGEVKIANTTNYCKPNLTSFVTTRGPDPFFNKLEEKFPSHFFLNKRTAPGIPHLEFLGNRIVIQHSRHGEITRRVFEAMLAGSLVLTDYNEKIARVFTNNLNILYYYSFSHLCSIMDFFIEQDFDSSYYYRITKMGHLETKNHHTVTKRVTQLLKAWTDYR